MHRITVAQLVGKLLLLRLLLSALGRGEAAESSTKPLRSSSSIYGLFCSVHLTIDVVELYNVLKIS